MWYIIALINPRLTFFVIRHQRHDRIKPIIADDFRTVTVKCSCGKTKAFTPRGLRAWGVWETGKAFIDDERPTRRTNQN